ncbi:MAG: hypothetical protein GTN74_03560 [Proteobacteria bacterium]|nr:hypothetical protein [Pseudomonadota bacterium]NIS68368.1 hypothetical protein [Pseudomonadota bacterium]
MHSIEVPESWERLESEIQKAKGTVMVIGAPDTGKTTLTRFLVRELCNCGEAVAYIDGDIGQSILGPPTTQAMAVFDGNFRDFGDIRPEAIYFVGSVSPRGNRLETIVGLKKLLERSQAGRTRIAILDTTGYVTGEDAIELKYQKMDLLDPRHIVALQHNQEIEPLLRSQRGRESVVIHRIPSSSRVQTRSQEERRRYRWSRFKAYFRTVRIHQVDLRKVSLTGTHRFRISEKFHDEMEGLLIGLNGPDNFLITLGILEILDRTRGALSCLVPSVAGLEMTQTVRLGYMRIDLSEETNGERFPGLD